ncbi:MAG: hypothetical protein AAB316_02455, partial [Bacteroidota bacterium]
MILKGQIPGVEMQVVERLAPLVEENCRWLWHELFFVLVNQIQSLFNQSIQQHEIEHQIICYR